MFTKKSVRFLSSSPHPPHENPVRRKHSRKLRPSGGFHTLLLINPSAPPLSSACVFVLVKGVGETERGVSFFFFCFIIKAPLSKWVLDEFRNRRHRLLVPFGVCVSVRVCVCVKSRIHRSLRIVRSISILKLPISSPFPFFIFNSHPHTRTHPALVGALPHFFHIVQVFHLHSTTNCHLK